MLFVIQLKRSAPEHITVAMASLPEDALQTGRCGRDADHGDLRSLGRPACVEIPCSVAVDLRVGFAHILGMERIRAAPEFRGTDVPPVRAVRVTRICIDQANKSTIAQAHRSQTR